MHEGSRQTDVRSRNTLGRRLRFVLRFLGLTALLVAGAAAVYGSTTVTDWTQWDLATAREALAGEMGREVQITTWLVGGGAVIALAALAIELLATFFFAAGRRSVAGTLATIQVILALALLVGVNYFSFRHHQRIDLTQDQQFTLPPEIQAELAKLKDETTIVVLQQHKTFGRLSERSGVGELKYDYAAERKVVEKVRDLVDQFREFGARFQVHVLDVEEEGFDNKLAEVTQDKPVLRQAITSAPENSIFFYANGRVQRLSFNDFYHLDKTASKERKNLVLLPQGLRSFTSRIFAIEERKPVIGVAVVHEWLTTKVAEGQEQFTLAGLRQSLESYGFEVRDIILKKDWNTPGEPKPAAYTYQESELDRLESEIHLLEEELTRWRQIRDNTRELLTDLQSEMTLEDLSRKYRLALGRWTETIRRESIDRAKEDLSEIAERIAELENDRGEVKEDLEQLLADERAVEDRRLTDVGAKLRRLLRGCDLLILPRHTLINATLGGGGIPPELHELDGDQVGAIKDFLKEGKPILACFGPINQPEGVATELTRDGVEELLGELGIHLSKQTILFDTETRAFAERRAGRELGGTGSDIPPLSFQPPDDIDEDRDPNPIGSSLRITARSVEDDLGLTVRHPRPVSIESEWKEKLPYVGTFIYSDEESWNEAKPFAEFEALIPGNPNSPRVLTYMPRYEPTKQDDPKKGTPAEERRGPFPIGVAIEVDLPLEWYVEEFGEWKGITGLVHPWDHAGIMSTALTALAQTKPSAARWTPESKTIAETSDTLKDRAAPSHPASATQRLPALLVGGAIASAGLSLGSASLTAPQAGLRWGLAEPIDRERVRVAVIGHGGIFIAPELKAAQEQLLLHTVNWLLGREERLPNANLPEWSFPRVEMTEQRRELWHWATQLGLPALCAYFGLVVLMVRRVR